MSAAELNISSKRSRDDSNNNNTVGGGVTSTAVTTTTTRVSLVVVAQVFVVKGSSVAATASPVSPQSPRPSIHAYQDILRESDSMMMMTPFDAMRVCVYLCIFILFIWSFYFIC